MKRHFKHVFTFLSAVSLLLCVVVCVLWARSYWVSDNIICKVQSTWVAQSNRGQLDFIRVPKVYPWKISWQPEMASHLQARPWWASLDKPMTYIKWDAYSKNRKSAFPDVVTADVNIGGFVWFVTSDAMVVIQPRTTPGILHDIPPATFQSTARWNLSVPHWFAAGLFALMPLVKFIRHRRHAPGHCPRCGYDLHASPERCPECGTPVVKETP
jgi:hypothetical protein